MFGTSYRFFPVLFLTICTSVSFSFNYRQEDVGRVIPQEEQHYYTEKSEEFTTIAQFTTPAATTTTPKIIRTPVHVKNSTGKLKSSLHKLWNVTLTKQPHAHSTAFEGRSGGGGWGMMDSGGGGGGGGGGGWMMPMMMGGGGGGGGGGWMMPMMMSGGGGGGGGWPSGGGGGGMSGGGGGDIISQIIGLIFALVILGFLGMILAMLFSSSSTSSSSSGSGSGSTSSGSGTTIIIIGNTSGRRRRAIDDFGDGLDGESLPELMSRMGKHFTSWDGKGGKEESTTRKVEPFKLY